MLRELVAAMYRAEHGADVRKLLDKFKERNTHS